MRPNWFVGWSVDAPGLADRLGATPDRVRLFAASDLHITLAFFGAVSADRARSAFDQLSADDFEAQSVTPTSLALMGQPHKGTALAADIGQGRQGLVDAMAAHRDALLGHAGASIPRYGHRPHATVARIGRRARASQREAALHWADQVDLEGLVFHLDVLALYTWASDRRSQLFQMDRFVKLPA